MGAMLKDTNLTQFAPEVIAGLYLSLFMFSGEHTVESDPIAGWLSQPAGAGPISLPVLA